MFVKIIFNNVYLALPWHHANMFYIHLLIQSLGPIIAHSTDDTNLRIKD